MGVLGRAPRRRGRRGVRLASVLCGSGRRRARPGASLWPFGGDGRAIKRARLTHRRARGSTDPSSRDEKGGFGTGGETVAGRAAGSGPVPSKRRVHVESPEPVTAADAGASADAGAGAARHDTLHETQLDGLLHIVQWIKPAAPPPPGATRNGRDAKRSETPDPNKDGFWLVPASFAGAAPPATHLALLPASATPGPAELRGTPAERAEAKRRVLLGLAVPDRLAGALAGCSADFGSKYAGAAAAAAAAAADDATRAFDAPALRSRVACELAHPTTYQELHAVVPMVASASPGGGIVCWSDDVALWARRAGGGSNRRRPAAVIDLRTCGFGADAVAVDAQPPAHADAVGGTPVLHHVAAMQWSASGRRLLVLLVAHIATAQHVVAKYRWLVWDPPSAWLFAGEDATAFARDSDVVANANAFEDDVGVITMGRWHVPSASFTNDCLSIFEQYTQTNSMWNPNEDAVAYPVRRDAAAGEDGVAADEIEIQHFPQTHAWRMPSDDLNAANVRQTADPARCLPFALAPAPAPVVVCEGSFCAWSPR